MSKLKFWKDESHKEQIYPEIDESNILLKDNTAEFIPTEDYNPATKKYVDEHAGADGEIVSVLSKESENSKIELFDSAEYPVQLLKIDGYNKQEITTGKNLAIELYDQTADYIMYSIDNTGLKNTMTYSFNFVSDWGLSGVELYIRTPSITGYKKASNLTILTTKLNEVTFDLTNAEIEALQSEPAIIQLSKQNGFKVSDYLSKVQLEPGSVATSYERYTERIPSPNPYNQQPIDVLCGNLEILSHGKNFLNISELDGYSHTDAGLTTTIKDNTITIRGTATSTSALIIEPGLLKTLEPGYPYSFSVDNKQLFDVELKGTYVGGSDFNIKVYSKSILRTINSVAKQTIRYGAYITGMTQGTSINTSFKIQLEKGGDDTLPEPYKESKLIYHLGDNFAGSIKDIQEQLIGNKINKRIGKIVLDGSEPGWAVNNVDQLRYPVGIEINGISLNNPDTTYVQSDYFITNNSSENTTASKDLNTVRQGSNNGKVWFMLTKTFMPVKTKEEILERWKIWLSEHPLTLYYVLAEPYEVEIPVEGELKTFNDYTLIKNSYDANMHVEYVQSFKYVSDVILKLYYESDEEIINKILSGNQRTRFIIDDEGIQYIGIHYFNNPYSDSTGLIASVVGGVPLYNNMGGSLILEVYEDANGNYTLNRRFETFSITEDMDSTGLAIPTAKTVKDYVDTHGGSGNTVIINYTDSDEEIAKKIFDNWNSNDVAYVLVGADSAGDDSVVMNCAGEMVYKVTNKSGLRRAIITFTATIEANDSGIAGEVISFYIEEQSGGTVTVNRETNFPVIGNDIRISSEKPTYEGVKLWIDPTEPMAGGVLTEVVDSMNNPASNMAPSVNAVKSYINGMVLYSDSAGLSNNITLSDSAANYSYFEIFAKVSNVYDSVKVFNPDGKAFSMIIKSAETSLLQMDASIFQISANKINIHSSKRINLGTSYMAPWDAENIKIVKVIGYK